MRIPGLPRTPGPESLPEKSPHGAQPLGRKPRLSLRRRLLRTFLLVGLFAAFTSPGRRFARTLARAVDRHVESFAEPESRRYSTLIAPLMSRLYRRAVDDVAGELHGIRRGARPLIVDVGCGTGELAVAISRKVRESRIVGLDASPSMLLYASRHETTDGRIRFMVGDGARMPFPNGSVDLVVSTLSIHHWADVPSVLAEIDRVLRPGGTALLYDFGLLTLSTREMARACEAAELPSDRMTFERVRGGLLSRLFVLYRFDRER